MLWGTTGYLIRSLCRRRLLLSIAAVAAVASALAAPVSGDPSGSVSATVPVTPEIKSVTVNPASLALDSCGSLTPFGYAIPTASLPFPMGECATHLNVGVGNNGTVAETVSVQGSNAVPSDGGTQWTLVPYPGAPTVLPNIDELHVTPLPTDQYSLLIGNLDTGVAMFLASIPAIDATVGTLPPGGGVPEGIALFGPSTSSDPSTQFSTTITWIAS